MITIIIIVCKSLLKVTNGMGQVLTINILYLQGEELQKKEYKRIHFIRSIWNDRDVPT